MMRRYELKAQGKLPVCAMERVPDAYVHNATLSDDVIVLQTQLKDAQATSAKVSTTWDTFRKERDFHRMHHKRVTQEKSRLIKDIKLLKDHYKKYEPTIKALKRKYEAAMKEKTLVSMDREKLKDRVAALKTELARWNPEMDTIKGAVR
jgi:sperm-associated antigen 16 protein